MGLGDSNTVLPWQEVEMVAEMTAPASAGAAADVAAGPIVRYDHVCKSFGTLEVLKDFNLDVPRRERLSILGPSGSGKSTALRLLMTLERPTTGEIWIEGKRLWHTESSGKLKPADEKHLRKMRTKVGYVFQQFNLFPHMSVLRNVTEGPVHVLGLKKDEAEERAMKLLDLVGLRVKAKNFPAQLSGGQQQRVAIARTLAMEPEILLCDEVTSALDVELVGEVLEVLRNLAATTTMTMIFVTHEIRFAREVSDRVIFIDGGRVVESGPPAEIFGNPKEERTRSFLKAVINA
jgi:polar amino acid transport system ATP-binding protein